MVWRNPVPTFPYDQPQAILVLASVLQYLRVRPRSDYLCSHKKSFHPYLLLLRVLCSSTLFQVGRTSLICMLDHGLGANTALSVSFETFANSQVYVNVYTNRTVFRLDSSTSSYPSYPSSCSHQLARVRRSRTNESRLGDRSDGFNDLIFDTLKFSSVIWGRLTTPRKRRAKEMGCQH